MRISRRRLPRLRPDLSVVVVCYEMKRELPRTVRSLSRKCQEGLDDIDYEIVVVDNGSTSPIHPNSFVDIDPRIRVENVQNAHPSPAEAVNRAVSRSTGRAVCVILDGARMVTPRTLSSGLRAMATHPRAVVTPMAWHLGPDHQSRSVPLGYGAAAEDELLEKIEWPADGYRLFDIAALAMANSDGFFGSINESCCLMLPRELWDEVGGLDERFTQPGGGLVALDLFTRLVTSPGNELIILLGEGSFHQVHGGASMQPDAAHGAWSQEYKRITGQPYRRPAIRPTYFGTMPEPARRWILPEK